jgi:hypothetical protein
MNFGISSAKMGVVGLDSNQESGDEEFPLSGSKNLTRLDIEVHDHTALQYSLDHSSKTLEGSHTLLAANQGVIQEDSVVSGLGGGHQKIMIADQLTPENILGKKPYQMQTKVFDLKQAEDQVERHARNIQHTSSKNYEDLGDPRVERKESGTTLGLIYLRQQFHNDTTTIQHSKGNIKESSLYDKKMTQTLGVDPSFKPKIPFARKGKLSTKYETMNTP